MDDLLQLDWIDYMLEDDNEQREDTEESDNEF